MAASVGVVKRKGEGEKEKGNDAFKKGRYAEAVGLYTEAVLADGSNPVFYLNRSMAYMKLSKFEDTERDASAAIRLGGDTVKAYFRRGTARKHLEKWQEAKADFDMVVHLDPTNAEAKAELMALQDKLAAVKLASERKPVDVDSIMSPSESKDDGKGQSNSSVEAARNFLEKVGMVDKPDQSALAFKQDLPSRLPGETGSLLKEMSTRRLVNNKPSDDPPSSSSNLSSQSVEQVTIGSFVALSDRYKIPKTIQTPKFSSETPINGNSSKLRLSAYELYRRLRQDSSSTDFKGQQSSQLELLSSLDINKIPSMLGSLLEPELLANILDALSQADETEEQLIIDIMSVLPQCERFETAYMFLEKSEKHRAVTILEKLQKADSSAMYNKLAKLWKI